MNDKLLITFEKSQDDIPVLIVGRENHMTYITGSPSFTIINIFTGDKAVEIWNTLENRRKKEK